MKSDVFRIKNDSKNIKESALRLSKLIGAADPFSKYKKDEIVPVKITVGDSRCIYHVHPEMVKTVMAELKKRKTRPFAFDTGVIYPGERTNAVDHLNLVNTKGFGQAKIGAPFIVADGLLGQDGREHEIRTANLEKVRLPAFVGMLDSLVVLSHATGHIVAGYAGAIKNVAMGMSCRATKQVQHSSIKPQIIKDKCTSCGCCIEICPVSAIALKEHKADINQGLCLGCGECICACKFDAVSVSWREETAVFLKRMVETAGFILAKFKHRFFVNFVYGITKECDCISTRHEEIIAQDVGILASNDPVSLDKATIDLINKNEDVFLKAQGNSEYYKMFEYAAQLGLGNPEYNLKTL